jgi:hypothetical protein
MSKQFKKPSICEAARVQKDCRATGKNYSTCLYFSIFKFYYNPSLQRGVDTCRQTDRHTYSRLDTGPGVLDDRVTSRVNRIVCPSLGAIDQLLVDRHCIKQFTD